MMVSKFKHLLLSGFIILVGSVLLFFHYFQYIQQYYFPFLLIALSCECLLITFPIVSFANSYCNKNNRKDLFLGSFIGLAIFMFWPYINIRMLSPFLHSYAHFNQVSFTILFNAFSFLELTLCLLRGLVVVTFYALVYLYVKKSFIKMYIPSHSKTCNGSKIDLSLGWLLLFYQIVFSIGNIIVGYYIAWLGYG